MLSKCQEALDRGETEIATSLARSRDTRGIKDAATHLAWAEFLEELGLMDEVILELNLALRDDPQQQETYTRLAEVYLDQGQPLQAAHVWEVFV